MPKKRSEARSGPPDVRHAISSWTRPSPPRFQSNFYLYVRRASDSPQRTCPTFQTAAPSSPRSPPILHRASTTSMFLSRSSHAFASTGFSAPARGSGSHEERGDSKAGSHAGRTGPRGPVPAGVPGARRAPGLRSPTEAHARSGRGVRDLRRPGASTRGDGRTHPRLHRALGLTDRAMRPFDRSVLFRGSWSARSREATVGPMALRLAPRLFDRALGQRIGHRVLFPGDPTELDLAERTGQLP